MPISKVATRALEIAVEQSGPSGGAPVILLHGWPDDARTWDKVLPQLHAAGFSTIVPCLRGAGATRFRSHSVQRSGQLSALAQDLLELADALRIERFSAVGHDWGARAAYIAAALAPERISRCVALSVGWGTNDPNQSLPLVQIRNYWYHWYLALDRGAELLRQQRRPLARFMWDSWSPPGWFSDAEFEATAASFDNPDWPEVVLHSYRHRWGFEPGDPTYAALEAKLNPTPQIGVPTLVLHGSQDYCNHPSTTLDRERFFSGRYARVLLDGVGHFPSREAPEKVAQAIIPFLRA
jgi:pimeloyl-ACP methyl ester carboxylesterase